MGTTQYFEKQAKVSKEKLKLRNTWDSAFIFDVNSFPGYIENLLVTLRKSVIKVNTESNEYVFASCDKMQAEYSDIKVGNKSFEIVEKLKV